MGRYRYGCRLCTDTSVVVVVRDDAVTLDGLTRTADSFASEEYFNNILALPNKRVSRDTARPSFGVTDLTTFAPQDCHVSFKAYTCYRFFPRCNGGQFFRMCWSTCDAYHVLCEKDGSLACSMFEGIAIDGDDCTGGASHIHPRWGIGIIVALAAAALAMWTNEL